MSTNIKMEKLKELLNDLVNITPSDLTDIKIEEYIKTFKEIYNNGFRHEYSEVTGILFEIDKNETRDILPEKLKTIINKTDEENLKNDLLKLWDHINLENIRLAKLQSISDGIKNTTEEMKKLKEEIDNKEKIIETMNEKVRKINIDIDDSNMRAVTVLGIFASIVISFTGGLTFVASALDNAGELSKYRLVLIIILLATAIFDIIFMLIYMLGKLTKTYIGSRCNCDNKFEGCAEKSIKCGIVRYPIAALFNLLSSISIVILIITYAIDKYDLLTKILNAENKWTYSWIILIVVVIFLLICMAIRLIVIQECNHEYFNNMPTLGIRLGGYRKKEEKKRFFPWLKKRKNELDIE